MGKFAKNIKTAVKNAKTKGKNVKVKATKEEKKGPLPENRRSLGLPQYDLSKLSGILGKHNPTGTLAYAIAKTGEYILANWKDVLNESGDTVLPDKALKTALQTGKKFSIDDLGKLILTQVKLKGK